MTSSQLTEATAYSEIEPWGEERADLRAAQSTAILAEVHRDRARRAKPYTPDDFMPFRVKRRESPRSIWLRVNRTLDAIQKKEKK